MQAPPFVSLDERFTHFEGTMIRKLLVAIALATTFASVTGCAGLKLGHKSKSSGPLSAGDPGYVDPGPFEGPLDQKYTGKVVFSSKPIAVKDTDDSAVYAGSYKLGDPLFIRFFDKDSTHNLLPQCRSPRRVIRVDLNGEAAGKPTGGIPGIGNYQVGHPNNRGAGSITNEITTPMNTATTWTAERETAANAVLRSFNSGIIASLHEGTNTLRVVLTADCGSGSFTDPVTAEGTLNIEVKPGAKKAYLAKFGTRLETSPNPQNAKLVPQIIKAMKAKPDWDNEDFLGARVTSEDWIPVRNDLTGVLVAQQVNAVLVVHAKKEQNPDVCRLFTMTYARDPAGGPLYYSGTGNPTPFPCVNAPN